MRRIVKEQKRTKERKRKRGRGMIGMGEEDEDWKGGRKGWGRGRRQMGRKGIEGRV